MSTNSTHDNHSPFLLSLTLNYEKCFDIVWFQREPIYNVFPLGLPEANTKISNMKAALADYVAEYSMCKCRPCHNNGTLVLIDGLCSCFCILGYEGLACQNHEADKKPRKGKFQELFQNASLAIRFLSHQICDFCPSCQYSPVFFVAQSRAQVCHAPVFAPPVCSDPVCHVPVFGPQVCPAPLCYMRLTGRVGRAGQPAAVGNEVEAERVTWRVCHLEASAVDRTLRLIGVES